MSAIAIGLNLLLAALLAATLFMGWRLNRRLTALRESHDGFTKAVSELDAAARRAEQGLAALRAATNAAQEELADRIDKARVLATQLERLTQQASSVAASRDDDELVLEIQRPTAESRLGALLGAARASRGRLAPEAPPRRPALAPRTRAVEDDLFDEPADLVLGARR
jgi:chromosome segregation ATPase